MIGLGTAGRASSRDLLAFVARDLDDAEVRRDGPDRAELVTASGRRIQLQVIVEQRKLMTLQESEVVVAGPQVVGPGRAWLELFHTGQLRRRGLAARVRGPRADRDDREVASLRDAMLAEDDLEAASLPLDVTRFRVAAEAGRWTARLRLMGGSHVRTRLPPGGSYVRLAEDQVSALYATLDALQRRLVPVRRPGERLP